MELRDIEIFLVLAEELHFGRTAQRLRVTRARVSQAIQQQERRLGGALFDRSSRIVRLAPLAHSFVTILDRCTRTAGNARGRPPRASMAPCAWG